MYSPIILVDFKFNNLSYNSFDNIYINKYHIVNILK